MQHDNKLDTYGEAPIWPKTPSSSNLSSVFACVLQRAFAGSYQSQEFVCQGKYWEAFYSYQLPSISVRDYFLRMVRLSVCSTETMVRCCFCINKLVESCPDGFQLDPFSIHRVILASLLCNAKFADDSHHANKFFSEIGGVALKELNRLEIHFLTLMNFSLHVHQDDLTRFVEAMYNGNLHNQCSCFSVATATTANNTTSASVGFTTSTSIRVYPSTAAAAAVPAGAKPCLDAQEDRGAKLNVSSDNWGVGVEVDESASAYCEMV